MRNFLSMDSPFFSALSRMADLVILNVIFLVCCIPVITIGASCTAMAYVMLKIREKEEGYIVRPFFKAFKDNFKQATLVWLILLAAAFVLFLDLKMSPAMGGTMMFVLRVMVGIAGIFWIMIFLYVFPLMARFSNTTISMLRNSVLVALANLPRTLLMILITAGAFVLTFYSSTTLVWGILVWMLIGFSLVSYLNAGLMVKIFHTLMESSGEEKNEEDPDAWTLQEQTEDEGETGEDPDAGTPQEQTKVEGETGEDPDAGTSQEQA